MNIKKELAKALLDLIGLLCLVYWKQLALLFIVGAVVFWFFTHR